MTATNAAATVARNSEDSAEFSELHLGRAQLFFLAAANLHFRNEQWR